MTIGEIYDLLPNDKLFIVNKYDDDTGDSEEIFCSLRGVLPLSMWSIPVTFIDTITGGMIVECNSFDCREVC